MACQSISYGFQHVLGGNWVGSLTLIPEARQQADFYVPIMASTMLHINPGRTHTC